MSKKRVAIIANCENVFELQRHINRKAYEIEADGGLVLNINVYFHESNNKAVLIYDACPSERAPQPRYLCTDYMKK